MNANEMSLTVASMPADDRSSVDAVPEIFNRPGLPALAYRIGTQPSVLQRMLDRLPREQPGADTILVGASDGSGPVDVRTRALTRPLATLTTRAVEDPIVAILDAWATVVDVITFYQERIANEGFLRTATERRSIGELARTIGYELNPGVAASTYLAFTVDPAKGAPGRATIAAGLRVQSVPGQDEHPQPFETSAALEARVEWNELHPQLFQSQHVKEGLHELHLVGTATLLRPGDAILIVGDERIATPPSNRWDLRILSAVVPDTASNTTRVVWAERLGSAWPPSLPAQENAKIFALRQTASLFGNNAPSWPVLSDGIKCTFQRADEAARYGKAKIDCDPNDYKTWPGKPFVTEWPGFAIRPSGSTLKHIDLDAAYPRFDDSGWIALESPTYRELYKVLKATTLTRTDFTLSAKVTRLELDTDVNFGRFHLRDTSVYGQSEPLALSMVPITTPLSGDVIVLDRTVPGLLPGRLLMVSGKRRRARVQDTVKQALRLLATDGTRSTPIRAGDVVELLTPAVAVTTTATGAEPRLTWSLRDRFGFEGTVDTAGGGRTLVEIPAGDDSDVLVEVATIRLVSDEVRDQTVLTLERPLRNTYDLPTVTIAANVVPATHGETVREVLGSGDGSLAFQRFTLKKPPLTYVAAPTPTGGASTLDVHVGGVEWEALPSLYALAADRQAYTVRIDDKARATVIFGDGHSGARLPSGQENVVAVYRSGIGPDGDVKAHAITLMASKPLGVREVTNPIPASGAAPPERLDDARTNAPLTVLTLDRVVSLRDVEDFARAFSGIGKAQAVAIWKGERHVVLLTVAGERGGAVDPDSALYKNLISALDAVRDPTQLVTVEGYELRTFSLEARLLIDPLFLSADVLRRAEEALRRAFSFERREFGQAVPAAEVVTVMQSVAGVLAVDLDELTIDVKPQRGALTAPPPGDDTRPPAAGSRGPMDWARVQSLAGDMNPKIPKVLLRAAAARLDTGGFHPAELLLINPDGIVLTEVTA